MTAMPRPGTWIPIAALALLGLALYARGLVLGFVGDDFTLLDAALRVPLGDLVSGRFGIPGYYRPVSRELYFWAWGRIAGLGPGGFHLVNAATFAATVFMLAQLARDLAGPRAARLAAAALVVFPAGSALLAWVSCAQDLIAMFWCAAALLLYARGRHGLAGAAALLAALSKETAAVLPAAIAVLEWQLAPRATPGERVRRLAPAAIGLIAAAAIAIAVRAGWPAGAAVAVWSPAQIMGAWQLPFDLLRTYLPPDAGAGIAQAFAEQPLLPVV
ncbi:MAG: glycosyltransferase family 39 protein, partial [Candidatus Eisenbacteria bacterium]|nr:glycosyltransferase family 39 protein [Candidatus Eisenbacteria bacterium]